MSQELAAANHYASALKRAAEPGLDPVDWFLDWYQAYLRAKILKLPQVEGLCATKEFLYAVMKRIAPGWAD